MTREIRKTRFRLFTILLLAMVLGMLSLYQANAQNAPPNHRNSTTTVSPATPPAGTYFDHLVFIIMENAGITDICGSNLPPPCNGSNNPYMSSLANSYGIETQYVDLAGSSQPNYIGIMAATLNGCSSGCGSNSLTEVNLVDRFEGAGVTWKAYMENQTPAAGCDNSDHGFYEFIHNPFVSFHDIDTDATRCNKIVLANPANNSTCTGTDCALINDLNSGSAPNFMWLTPNDCNSMHGPISGSCSNGCVSSYTAACNRAGDNYLSGLVPNILNSNTFKNTRAALFITFDEGSGFCPSPNPSGADCMYTVWAGPTTKTNFSSNHADTHYFFTKTIETNWGLATMTANDAAATAMAEFFTAPPPDFSISASSPAPMNAGQSGTSTITVSALNGFSGTVALTDTIPSGLTCGSITPNSITGSGTATVSCSATSAGNYTLTITGTSGSLVHAATALFQFRDFTVAASIVTVNAGASGASTITVTAINRFAATVTLTDNVPSGLVCGSITPGSVTGSGTATVSCSAALSGNYTLTITGTSSSLVHTATPIFHIQDFGIAASSPAPVNAGSSVTSTITISSINHFAGVVSLTDTIPSGLTCGTITPSSITGSGSATVSCSATIAGNYTLTLTGTGGSLVHSAVALFQYRDFTISAGSPSPVNAGSSAITTVTVNSVNQFGGIVNLTDTVPSGLACGSITPSSITGSGTATISCTSTVAGNYTLTVTGTSGSLIHSATAFFQFRDFTTSATTPGAVDSTQSATSIITIAALNHFNGIVNLTGTAPVGLTCGAITPTSVTGSGTATVSCSASVAGNYTLTITGSSGSLLHSAVVVLRFQDFTITATSPAAVNAGQTSTSTVTVAAVNGFTGTVTFSVTPSLGLTCGSFSPTSIIASGLATISCSATVAGNYTATITGTSTPLIHNATATFQFRDFTIIATSPAPLNAGNSATSTITVAPLNHFAGPVGLTDAVPSGLTCGTITPSSVTGSGIATVSCNATVAGNYTLTVTGTSGSLVHTVISIFRFQDFNTSTSSPAPANAGSSATSTITVTAVNGFAGAVTFSDSVPSGLTCGGITPASITGSGTAIVSCSATVAGSYVLTVTGNSGSLIHTANATFNFVDFTIAASSPAAVNAGSSAISTITVTALNGFTGVVTLTDTVPASLTCGSITPGSVTGAGTATVSCSATIAGTYVLTVTGTSGSLVHNATATFNFVDFTIATSSPGAVNAGQSASSTITITAVNGFAGVVTLTDTVPAGLTCGAVTPGTVTGSGIATVSCSATVAGNYTLALTGMSGILVHSAIALFQFRDFTITATSLVTANVGASTPSTLTVSALNHFSGSVLLSDTVPGGLACGVISPVSVTGSGTATVSCSASLAGNYTLTLTGTSGQLVHSATTLFQFWDFSSSASSPAPLNAGTSATSTVTITSANHFNGIVSLTDTAFSGLVCGTINPTSVTGSGTATISCNASAAGNYTLTIVGTSGSLVHNATALFQFQDFTLSASSPATVNANSSAASTITVTALNLFAGTVALSDTLPPGLTCSAITPANIVGYGSANVSCTAPLAGNYALTITGTSGALSHSVTATFVIVDFGVSSSQSTITILIGSSQNSTVTVSALNHFNGTVILAVNSPSALTSIMSSLNVTGSGSSTLTVTASTAGNYTITVIATSGSLSHSISLTVRAENFALNVDPGYAIVVVGSSTNMTPSLTSLNGFSGNLTLSVTVLDPIFILPTLPSSGTHLPIRMDPLPLLPSATTSTAWIMLGSGGVGEFTITITAPPGVAAAYYPLIVTASNGTVTHSILITIIVRDFSLTAPVGSVTMMPGTNSTTTLGLRSLDGFFGNATLSVQGASGGVSGNLSASIVYVPFNGGSSAVLTIQVSSTTLPGNYTLTIQATSGTVSHTISLLVIVRSNLFTTIISRMLASTSVASSTVTGLVSILIVLFTVTSRRKPSRPLKGPGQGASPNYRVRKTPEIPLRSHADHLRTSQEF